MTLRTLIVGLLVAGVAVIGPSRASASPSSVEIGTSITGVTFGTGDNDVTMFGVPSSSFGVLNPSFYASLFLGSRVAVEPQLGLIVLRSGGETMHNVNVSGQVDYFPVGTGRSSPFVFANVGLVDVSGSNTTPKAAGGGAGYRMRVGDRLTFRLDGRVTHFTENGGNLVAFSVSIGGVLGR